MLVEERDSTPNPTLYPDSKVIASAETNVNATADVARRWFEELDQYPERYRFAKHEGIFVEEGKRLNQVGTEFKTREKLFGSRTMSLLFRINAIAERSFDIVLLRPGWPVWGRFEFTPSEENEEQVRLGISISTMGNSFQGALLRLPFIRNAVRMQITAEVEHIARSIEQL